MIHTAPAKALKYPGGSPKPVPAQGVWDLGSPGLEDLQAAPKNQTAAGNRGVFQPFCLFTRPSSRGSSSDAADAFGPFLAFPRRVPQPGRSRPSPGCVFTAPPGRKALRVSPSRAQRAQEPAAGAQHPGRTTRCPFAGDVRDSTLGDTHLRQGGRQPGDIACLPFPALLPLPSARARARLPPPAPVSSSVSLSQPPRTAEQPHEGPRHPWSCSNTRQTLRISPAGHPAPSQQPPRGQTRWRNAEAPGDTPTPRRRHKGPSLARRRGPKPPGPAPRGLHSPAGDARLSARAGSEPSASGALHGPRWRLHLLAGTARPNAARGPPGAPGTPRSCAPASRCGAAEIWEPPPLIRDFSLALGGRLAGYWTWKRSFKGTGSQSC